MPYIGEFSDVEWCKKDLAWPVLSVLPEILNQQPIKLIIMKKKSILQVAVLGAFAFAAVTTASAVPSLQVFDGAGNTSGIIAGPTGTATFNGGIGKWTVNVDTGITKPLLGSATSPNMDLNFVDLFADAAGTASVGQKVLTVMWSDTDFTGPAINLLKTIGGTLGAGVSLTYQAFASVSNALFAQTTAIGSVLSFNASPFSGSSGGVGVAGPYSLTQVITLTWTGGATNGISSSGDATLAAVPDGGASIALLGLALVGLQGLRRKLKIA